MNKDKHFIAQEKQVKACFYRRPLTRMQVSAITGVRIQNICRFVRTLRENNEIQVISKGICPITKQGGVEFLTTNKKYWHGRG